MKNILLFLCLFFSLWSSKALSQSVFLSENAQISVLTCGSGDQLYSIFGHTAIRVHDPEKAIDVVYNYGTFDFNTSFFYLKFIQGNLEYFMSYSTFEDFIRSYEYENRDVFEQTLSLNRTQKQALFERLNQQLFSEDKFYTYKFIDRNCTTMVVEKTESIFEDLKLDYQNTENLSYRAIINQYLEHNYFERLGINIMFGAPTDQVSNQIFLPNHFLQSLETTQHQDTKIAQPTKVLFQSSPQPAQSIGFNNIYFFSILLLGLVLIKKKSIDLIFLSLMGLIGVFLSVLGLISDHQEVLWNYNILFINPLLILFVFAIIKQKTWLKKIGLGYGICLGIYLLFAITKSGFLTLLPLTLTITYLVFRNQTLASKK